MSKRVKEEKEKEPHWQSLIGVFFRITRELFPGEEPSFDGSAPRDLKNIVSILKKRAEKSNVEWTEENATKRLEAFLRKAGEDAWLHDHWILFNLNRFKDKVFFNTITPRNNGNNIKGGFIKKPNPEANTSGSFGKL